MLFNTYSFLVFFAFVLIVSRLLTSWRWRKFFLLLASYVFYAAWNPVFVILLWISTLADWFLANAINRSSDRRTRYALLLVSLAVNLGMLGYFKYAEFLVKSLMWLIPWIPWDPGLQSLSIVLPVGISFYTFQTLSYTIDVYKGDLKPGKSFLDYALYVTFFPQLVAGPIVRASDFLPQCVEEKKGNSHQIGWGLTLFCIGVFAKVVLADTLAAPVANQVYGSEGTWSFMNAWIGTLAFAMQIFYDFFGYTTSAIGVALCLGFELPDNFRFPYAARGFSDFWRRWHISLSTWLRDYLYIPLGGNRRGLKRTEINLMITMLLGGLWHGASWLFVIWGGLHGLYLVVERVILRSFSFKHPFWRSWISQAGIILLTFALVTLTWVFFRASSLDQALSISGAMLGLNLFSDGLLQSTASTISMYDLSTVAGLTLATLVSHYYLSESNLEEFFEARMMPVRVALIVIMLYLTIISMAGEDNAFIYFQF